MGWTGKVLRIDLTSGTSKTEPLNMEWADKYLGQRGLASKYLVEEVDPGPLAVVDDEGIADLEQRVRERGALTLFLGSDDEDDQTTLAGVDLYPNPLEHLARIQNLRGHPYEFYQKLGFVPVDGEFMDAGIPHRKMVRALSAKKA